MNECLWAFCNYEQNNWADLYPLVEFVYNNSVHSMTRMIPFWAMYHRNSEMQFIAPEASNLKLENQSDATLEGLADKHQRICENTLQA